jgi:Protein of unknown function (DUF3179)
VFRAEAKGQPLVLDNAGVVEGNEVFKDRGTGSRWQQSSLRAISGPLEGTRLQLYPFLLTNWREWRRLHPNTLVLRPLPGYAERIPEKNRQIREGLSGRGAAPDDVTYHDDRMTPKTMVLGVDVDGDTKAFPLESLRRVRVVNDVLGGKPVLLVHQPGSDTTTAFVARANGKTMTFEAANADASTLVDHETGSRWNAYGDCVSGPLKGSTLETIVLEPEYWFAWSEFHRGTKIYSPPRP